MDYYIADRWRHWLASEEEPADKPEEECGIMGLYTSVPADTFSLSEFALFALQHRGQEACGVAVAQGKQQNVHKGEGLVLDVFKKISDPQAFMGSMAIGHTRYTTAGSQQRFNFQPFFSKNEEGTVFLSIAHNGNLINAAQLRQELQQKGYVFKATSDSEVILKLIEYYLGRTDLKGAILAAMRRLRGAYSVVGMTLRHFFAFRDSLGIRPLVFGKTETGVRIWASETVALDAIGATYLGDMQPGEVVIAGAEGEERFFSELPKKNCLCAFEYIYFARPDSFLEAKSVYAFRVACGRKIFEQQPVAADVVLGVPDSGVPAAIGFSEASGIPFKPVLIKNKYISRSFILPTQELRDRLVRLKFNPVFSQLKGKRVVVLDDSIVRGTTAKRLVRILREAGAKEIHFRSVSPPIIAPCFLGIDTPDKKQLVSANRMQADLQKDMDVDSLAFLDLERLKELLPGSTHCLGCFTGVYPTDDYN